MCGIFGFVAGNKAKINKGELEGLVDKLFHLSERRGQEAAGIALSTAQDLLVYKQAIKSFRMRKTKEFRKIFDRMSYETSENDGSKVLKAPVAFIGHTRLVTNGTQVIRENNQPIVADRTVGVHSGVIANEDDMRKMCSNREEKRMNDSALLFNVIDKFYMENSNAYEAITRTFKMIIGSASVAFFNNNMKQLFLATNTGSLYYWLDQKGEMFAFASERYILEKFLKKNTFLKKGGETSVSQVEPRSCLTVDMDTVSTNARLFDEDNIKQAPGLYEKKELNRIIDLSLPKRELRRCSKCVLPETYPFISFDEEGACNYCRKYEKQKFLGLDALKAILDKHRSKNNSPDCILGFSGGRDSTYALHFLKNEMKMNPIAYTFDWALVTDQARKNQAKAVGKLGVEHIIRAADLHKQRRHIRKNIYAWLKRPRLGMVPLFMAGDKMFYFYGKHLRKETGIDLTIFAAGQQLEQMEFKVGFCGIDQHLKDNTKLYHFDMAKKMMLAFWYCKEYMLNPSYINEALFESIFAFYSSFLNKDDFLYLYRYIPWDEKLIEKILKEEYGWASDERFGKNQWRMGDGQTAFINYIYYTLAGFSEFDNFRSNQIREGMLTRDEAVKLAEEDNKPRIEMLQDFSQLIGFNLEEVLLKINAIPKIYK